MPSTTDSALTGDRIRILTRHWEAAGSPRAAVLLVHGVGEHSGRWEDVGAQLAAAGLEVFGWDLRGFGGSDGPRAWVDRFSRYHDDVEDRLAAARGGTGNAVPVVLYGHSMGGLISLGYCLADRPMPDLLVLSAPGIADDLAAWKHVAAPILARVAPRLMIANGISPTMLSRDPARHAAVATDPLVVGSSTTQLGALAFAEQSRVRAAMALLAVPTLVIHGAEDPIVPVAATAPLADVPGVTRRVYPGIRHELHNEPEGPAIVADVIAWIDDQLASRIAGPVAAAV